MNRANDVRKRDLPAPEDDLELLQTWAMSLAGLDFILIALFAAYAILNHTPLSVFLHPSMALASSPLQMATIALLAVNVVTGGILLLLAKRWVESKKPRPKTSTIRRMRSPRRSTHRVSTYTGGKTWPDQVLAEWVERQRRRRPPNGPDALP